MRKWPGVPANMIKKGGNWTVRLEKISLFKLNLRKIGNQITE